jgi:hypothetical protein
MDKIKKLPKEMAVDGLPGTDDVEGHVRPTEGEPGGPEELGTRLPGTGGDFRRPSGGGELIDDTAGHSQGEDSEAGLGPEHLGQRLPGTGGDFRRPSGGGELIDDVEA